MRKQDSVTQRGFRGIVTFFGGPSWPENFAKVFKKKKGLGFGSGTPPFRTERKYGTKK